MSTDSPNPVSEVDDRQADQSSVDQPLSSSGDYGWFRRLIVFLALIAVVLAGLYEFRVARPEFRRLLTVLDLDEGTNKTDDQIHRLFEREPNDVEELEDHRAKLETYRVQRGFPFTSFELYVWYQRIGGQWYLSGHQIDYPPEIDRFLPAKIVVTADRENPPQVVFIEGNIIGSSSSALESPYERPTEDQHDDESAIVDEPRLERTDLGEQETPEGVEDGNGRL